MLGINIGKNKDTPNDKAADDYLYLPRARVSRSPTTSRSTSPRPTPPACATCRKKRRCAAWSANCASAQEELGTRARPAHADAGEDRAGPDRRRAWTAWPRCSADAQRRRRDRQQHHARPQRDRRPPARGRGRRPVRRAALRPAPPPCCASCACAWTIRSRSSAWAASLSGADAAGKITAGAKLVQFYTGMVYRGPELVGECVASIRRLREGGK